GSANSSSTNCETTTRSCSREERCKGRAILALDGEGCDSRAVGLVTKRRVLWVVGPLAGLFLALQLVPYGWEHSNPPVTANAPWPTPEAERLARAACYDCHSNETDWPVYSYVAPFSWLVRSDVEGGRD